jgi:hypothetical protein
MDNYAQITTKIALFRQGRLKNKLKKVIPTDNLNFSSLLWLENSMPAGTTQLRAQKGNYCLTSDILRDALPFQPVPGSFQYIVDR